MHGDLYDEVLRSKLKGEGLVYNSDFAYYLEEFPSSQGRHFRTTYHLFKLVAAR